MKRQKQPSKIYDYPLPFENDGIKVDVVSKWRVPKRMKARDTYTSQSWSYRLEDFDDGIGQYAYWGYDKMLKRDYYYVLKIEDQELLETLTYYDRLEEKNNRDMGRHESLKWQQHLKKLDLDDSDDEPVFDPRDVQTFREWSCLTKNSEEKAVFPMKSQYAVIHSIVQQLPPKARRVYEYLYEKELSEVDIKKELQLEDSAWTNEKTRFWVSVREVFEALGYDVPNAVEKAASDEKQDKLYEETADFEEEELALKQEGRQIAWELKETESGRSQVW